MADRGVISAAPNADAEPVAFGSSRTDRTASSCNGPNIWHRTKWGFGCRERLKAKDKALIASRRRAHPVRRSWAAGRRLPGDLGRYEEAYLIESWLELMHLRERVTNADRVLEDEIREMLIAPPRIEFLIAAERGDQARNRRVEPAGA
jgi:hypothetical protein